MKRDIFQAIADPTRRAILVLIATQPMTPNVLAEYFDSTRQAVSKHIKILYECQLLKPTKSGREIYYTIDPSKVQEIDKWLDHFKGLLEKRFSQLDEVLINLNANQNEN
jgi:DNA-binding transcriptional ArsR family regulator